MLYDLMPFKKEPPLQVWPQCLVFLERIYTANAEVQENLNEAIDNRDEGQRSRLQLCTSLVVVNCLTARLATIPISHDGGRKPTSLPCLDCPF